MNQRQYELLTSQLEHIKRHTLTTHYLLNKNSLAEAHVHMRDIRKIVEAIRLDADDQRDETMRTAARLASVNLQILEGEVDGI